MALLVGLAAGGGGGFLGARFLPAAPPPVALDGTYYVALENRLKHRIAISGDMAMVTDEAGQDAVRLDRIAKDPPYVAFADSAGRRTLQVLQDPGGDLLAWIPEEFGALPAWKQVTPDARWDLLGSWTVYADRDLSEKAEVLFTPDSMEVREVGENESRTARMQVLSSAARPILMLTTSGSDKPTLLHLAPAYSGCYAAWEDDDESPAYLFRRGVPPDWTRLGVRPTAGKGP